MFKNKNKIASKMLTALLPKHSTVKIREIH